MKKEMGALGEERAGHLAGMWVLRPSDEKVCSSYIEKRSQWVDEGQIAGLLSMCQGQTVWRPFLARSAPSQGLWALPQRLVLIQEVRIGSWWGSLEGGAERMKSRVLTKVAVSRLSAGFRGLRWVDSEG